MKRASSVLLTFSFLLLPLFAHVNAVETSSPAPTHTANSAQASPSVTSPSVQSAIVASVENNRKRFGGHEPVPATLIGIWDNKGGLLGQLDDHREGILILDTDTGEVIEIYCP